MSSCCVNTVIGQRYLPSRVGRLKSAPDPEQGIVETLGLQYTDKPDAHQKKRRSTVVGEAGAPASFPLRARPAPTSIYPSCHRARRKPRLERHRLPIRTSPTVHPPTPAAGPTGTTSQPAGPRGAGSPPCRRSRSRLESDRLPLEH